MSAQSADLTSPKNGERRMSATSSANDAANARTVDMKLEIVVVPVSDVDRAKRFYGRLGWRLDADFDNGDDWRVIQFTPPGSGCSRQTSPPLQRRRRASLDRLRPPTPSTSSARFPPLVGRADANGWRHRRLRLPRPGKQSAVPGDRTFVAPASADASWSNACVHCRSARGAAETTAAVGACGEDPPMPPCAPGQDRGPLHAPRPAPKPASDPRRATGEPVSRHRAGWS